MNFFRVSRYALSGLRPRQPEPHIRRLQCLFVGALFNYEVVEMDSTVVKKHQWADTSEQWRREK